MKLSDSLLVGISISDVFLENCDVLVSVPVAEHDMSHAGCGVVRIDLLHFLARCRKRQLNLSPSVFVLVYFSHCVVDY